MKIAFVGFGNMAQAIAQQLTKNSAYEIFAASPSRTISQTANGVYTHSDNLAVIEDSHIVVLAVKPQQADNVLKQIGPALPIGSLLISIAAGLSLDYLASRCRPGQAIVRSMPNLPIAIGKGATPLIANEHLSLEHRNDAQRIFECGGIVAWLERESDIDKISAISGSGPAYLFYFLEAMISAGQRLGLSESAVKAFVLQTVAGASEMALKSDVEPSELQRRVTSKGGITAAAIGVLEKREFSSLISDAIGAAVERAKQLGQGV